MADEFTIDAKYKRDNLVAEHERYRRRVEELEAELAVMRGAPRDDQNDDVETLASARGFLYRHRDCGREAHAQWKRTIGAWDLVCPTCGPLRGEDVDVQPGASSAAYPNPSSGAAPKGEQEDLRLACDALAALVREEFPSDHSLADIISIWTPSGMGEQHVEALRAYETGEPLASPNPNPVSPPPDRLTPEDIESEELWRALMDQIGVQHADAAVKVLRARLADREPE